MTVPKPCGGCHKQIRERPYLLGKHKSQLYQHNGASNRSKADTIRPGALVRHSFSSTRWDCFSSCIINSPTSASAAHVCLRCGRLTFDTKSRLAMADGQPIPLTRKESGVLEYLLLHQGRPVSQEELIEHVWDSSVDAFSNSIRVHISALRKKLRTALGYDPIRNRIGEGYELEENEP